MEFIIPASSDLDILIYARSDIRAKIKKGEGLPPANPQQKECGRGEENKCNGRNRVHVRRATFFVL